MANEYSQIPTTPAVNPSEVQPAVLGEPVSSKGSIIKKNIYFLSSS